MESTQNPNQYVFGLDIGTRSIVGTVGFKNRDNRFQVVAQVSREHTTRAMLDGQIHNIEAVSQTIVEVKHELEKKLNLTLQDVCIAAAGRVLKTVTVTAEHTFETEQTISKEMVHSLELFGIEQAYEKLKQESSDKYNYYCVGYTVVKSYLNDFLMLSLEEHKGSKISVDLLATFLPEEVIDGLYKAVEKANLKVANLTLEPIAAMEVAIPENIRLLNLALVDVGAGTSDISITKDGSIIAFGMIPFAGDEITEFIAKKYLVDFNAAEDIKQACLNNEEITYTDILGIPHDLKAADVVEAVDAIVQVITKKIAEKIIELNGDKTVSAVFVVGGGGKLSSFVPSLAKYLDLPEERVALRGKEVLTKVDFLDDELEIDSTLVTPVGICLNYYEKRNNFVYVTVNGEILKLYDNNRLTVLDAALSIGISTIDLFPRRGKNLEFVLNGEKKVIKGLLGEVSQIFVNKKEANMTTAISSNDVIELKKSVPGADASYSIKDLGVNKQNVTFVVNGIEVTCPGIVEVNKKRVYDDYVIQNGDQIRVLNYYTVAELLEFLDLEYNDTLEVNGVYAGPEERVYENYMITFDYMAPSVPVKKQVEEEVKPQTEEVQPVSQAVNKLPKEESAPIVNASEEISIEEKETSPVVINREPHPITVDVNGKLVHLDGKGNYILVDVLDVYEFDTAPAATKRLILTVNDEIAEFLTPIDDGDRICLFWK